MALKKRVLISSDFLATSEAEQKSNSRWMFDLLRRPIEMGTDLQVDIFTGHDEGGSQDTFLRERFFELSGVEVDAADIQIWFDPASISVASKDYLLSHVQPTDLIVGYELSEATRALLSSANIDYLDLWLHPVRFLDDIMFAAGSNDKLVWEAVRKGAVSEDLIRMYADRIRVQSYKGWKRSEADIEPGSALFIGQMRQDKSVCRDGNFLSLLDFQAEFEEIVQRYPHVYYSRHPHIGDDDVDILAYLTRFPNVSVTEIPTYKLLSHENIDLVTGVSSSALIEAGYFGKSVEYLYRPVLDFGTGQYVAIQHEVLNPLFWHRALNHLLEAGSRCKSVPDLKYSDTKDKLRDALGFYWGYAAIDKLESSREAVKKNSKAGGYSGDGHVRIFGHTEAQIIEAQRLIQQSDVVSFDVFDTLIERPVEKPEDIFGLVSARMNDIALKQDGAEIDFLEDRKASRKWASTSGLAIGEEVPLDARYRAIGQKRGLSSPVVEEMYQLELQKEFELCRTRWVGETLFRVAKGLNKRIILTSDTFFDKDFMEALLTNCGYEGYGALYLSSDVGALKASGKMFSRVLDAEQVRPEKLVHIGDNEVSDIHNAKRFGLKTIYIPEKTHLGRRYSKVFEDFSHISNTRAQSVIKSLAASRFLDAPLPEEKSVTAGRVDVLGYALLGPVFLGFAGWILRNAIDQGIKDVYFLARDGKIAKECYDLIAPAGAPKSHYIKASRRALKVASLKTSDDILEVMKAGAASCSLRELLSRRFGLEEIDQFEPLAKDCGFQGLDERVGWKQMRRPLRSFLTSKVLVEAILQNAEQERGELQQYYEGQGLTAAREGAEVAFVDIGHLGSLQKALGDLLSLTATTGYYFSTMGDVAGTLGPGGHQWRSYYGDQIQLIDQVNPYKNNLLLYETIFLSDEDSFVRMRDGEPETLGDPTCARSKDRKELSRELHDSAIQFVSDFSEILPRYFEGGELVSAEVVQAFERFCGKPARLDAEIFEHISFENTYNAKDERWIIPPPGASLDSGHWREGYRALYGSPTSPSKKKSPAKSQHGSDRAISFSAAESFLGARAIGAFASVFLDKARLLKYFRDPIRFFEDSRKPWVRWIGGRMYKG